MRRDSKRLGSDVRASDNTDPNQRSSIGCSSDLTAPTYVTTTCQDEIVVASDPSAVTTSDPPKRRRPAVLLCAVPPPVTLDPGEAVSRPPVRLLRPERRAENRSRPRGMAQRVSRLKAWP